MSKGRARSIGLERRRARSQIRRTTRSGHREKGLITDGREMAPPPCESFREITLAWSGNAAGEGIAPGYPEPSIRASTSRPGNSLRHVSVRGASPYPPRAVEQGRFNDHLPTVQRPLRDVQDSIDMRDVLQNPFCNNPRNACDGVSKLSHGYAARGAPFCYSHRRRGLQRPTEIARLFALIWMA